MSSKQETATATYHPSIFPHTWAITTETEQLKRLFDLAINATSLDEIEQAMSA